MSYGLGKILALSTCTFGDVQLKQGLIGIMKTSWIQRQLVANLLGTLNTLAGTSFITPLVEQFLKREMKGFLRM